MAKQQTVAETAAEATYQIVRQYYSGGGRVVRRGLTLAEAQAHCRDRETCSRTATRPENVRRTLARGQWFDGFAAEVR